MTINTNVDTLIINKLTKAQYEAIEQKDPAQLYILTDVDAADAIGEDTRNAINALIEEASNHATKEELAAFVAEVNANASRLLRYKGSVQTYADLPTEDLAIGDSWNIVEADEEHDVNAGDNAVWTGEEWDILSGKIDLSAYALDENVVHLTGEENIYGTKTFKDSIILERQTTGPILELASNAGTTYLSVTRGTGANQDNVVLEAGGTIGLVGTKSNHPFTVRTNYVDRITFGTDGSVVLAKAPLENSSDNQVATTAWTRNLVDSVKKDAAPVVNIPAGESETWAVYSYMDIFGDNPPAYRVVKKNSASVSEGDIAYDWDNASKSIISDTEYTITGISSSEYSGYLQITFESSGFGNYWNNDGGVNDYTVITPNETITLEDNSINTIELVGDVTFVLPEIEDTTKFHQILIQLKMTEVHTIALGTTRYFGNKEPEMNDAGIYNIIYEYDNFLGIWVVGSIYKGSI